MAYTLFDLATFLKKQKTLETRLYDRKASGTRDDDALYGDIEVLDKKTHKILISVNDRLAAANGNDALYGIIGDDWLLGGNGDDFLDGGDGSDLVVGEAGDDFLDGGAGDDFLSGGTGIDEMHGGKGGDTYVVDHIDDQIVETPTGTGTDPDPVTGLVADTDIDTVQSAVSFTLGDYLENLVLTGKANIDGAGNKHKNILYGNSGINVLTGGDGDDHYYVQNSKDEVIEASTDPDKEWNVVFASASFALTAGSQVDELLLTGKAALTATGNDEDNVIEGNAGNNRLYGGGGRDWLGGVPLDLTIEDGQLKLVIFYWSDEQGTDVLYGGPGDDWLIVSKADRIVEYADEGIDTAVSGFSYTLGANIENLDLCGPLGSTEALKGTGNTLDNYIISNLGVDTLTGGKGDDRYMVYNKDIVISERANEGHETVYARVDFRLAKYVEDLVLAAPDERWSTTPLVGFGNTLDNRLWGNDGDNALDGLTGNDTLAGGLGNDQLTGGAGEDLFVFDTAPDAEKNKDLIHDFRSGEDTIRLDRTVFTALVAGPLDATDFVQGAGAGAAPAASANEHLLFDTDTGTLFYDIDGVGATVATAVAVLKPGVNGYLLAAADFVVV